MSPLKNVLTANADKVLYVFYDFELTQYKRNYDTAKAHVSNLVSVQKFCAKFDDVEFDRDCE